MPERLNSIKKTSYILLALLAAYCLSGSSSVSAKVVKVVGSEVTHSIIRENRLFRQIEFLSDSLCAGRGTDTRGATEAAFWLVRRFRQTGLKPFGGSYVKTFRTAQGLVGRNIMGVLPGGGKNPPDSYIVVAAHYDGIGELDGKLYPGADSNASGIVAMSGVAEMLSAMAKYGKNYGRSVIFIALDAKRYNMGGASFLWEMIAGGMLEDPVSGKVISPEKVSLMINIDQIGSSLSPLSSDRKDYMIMLAGDSPYFASALTAANLQYGIGLDLAFDYYGSKDFSRLFYRKISEHKIFLDNGKNAVLFTSGLTMNNNKQTDRAETLDMEVLKKRIWLIFHWIERII